MSKILQALGVVYVQGTCNILDLHEILKKRRFVLIEAWETTKDVNSLLKHKEFVKSFYSPKYSYRTKVEFLLTELKRKKKYIVAVHIRRGDYRDYLGGKYFFDDDFYMCYIRQLRDLFKGEVIFYLFSNEELVLDSYCNIDIFYNRNSHFIEDLYAMSKCDYIIGPPSTFSMWASFYGDVPIAYITDSIDKLVLEDFFPIKYQNIHSNGNTIRF